VKGRIVIDNANCRGKLVIKGTGVLVSSVIADLALGLSKDCILSKYPEISPEDIHAILAFAGEINQLGTFPIGNL